MPPPSPFQDFVDIVSQPSLEGPSDTDKEDEDVQDESNESSFLSSSAVNMLVTVHQRLCLGHAQSLWYRTPPLRPQPPPST